MEINVFAQNREFTCNVGKADVFKPSFPFSSMFFNDINVV